ncbi:hypothetical protein V1514DRAFT_233494 [Lipomyces japonicus]|uniref:uncharacterized protein n=1 Tax=Lipomyces japonicus TaxID=56871 RepID=UPI0034CE90EC
MHSLSGLFFLVLLSLLLVNALELDEAPACYEPCIQNTKIISDCSQSDVECFCKDEIYQNALYGCLYSQCSSKDVAFAQNLADSSCVRFNIQPGANPHLAKRNSFNDISNHALQSSSFAPIRQSSSVLIRRSSSAFGSLSSSAFPIASAAHVAAAAPTYVQAPAEAKHIVKRMESYGLNQCGQSCFYSKLLVAGCSPTDLSCVCSSAYFNAVTDCLVDQCYDQIPLAFKVRPELCQ